ncbi:MAG: M23 family metallopeptidase [Parvularculaceae bacterium]|nr:M23 family metallopeptidase [Parvularculaceae bacterium]
MSRKKPGQTKRAISRWFKERQIYHRSDGVVHFISMSTRTQIALASVIGAALLWVAYASVNVVFKEQIIVAKERDRRVLETVFNKRLAQSQRAYDDVSSLNVIMQREFDATMAEISSRHQTLKSMVERKASVTNDLQALSKSLSDAGSPNGQKPSNGNRIMIDVAPAEPTPRQSRVSMLRRQATREANLHGTQIPPNSPAAPALQQMRSASSDLYVEQVLLLASLEERASRKIEELKLVLSSTGVGAESLTASPKITNLVLAQGGPFIDPANMSDTASPFFRHANRAALVVDQLRELQNAVNSVPLSSPVLVSRKFTSGFGVRRDPITGRAASHHGIDFSAAWASPISSTASGVVKFAGVKSGFGRCVEVDHGNGFMTRYAHLNRIVVKQGQKVKLNQKVGELGNSGRSTGPHVHYEVIFRGQPRNPLRFIEAGRYVFES